jgi:hypothetical protein
VEKVTNIPQETQNSFLFIYKEFSKRGGAGHMAYAASGKINVHLHCTAINFNKMKIEKN